MWTAALLFSTPLAAAAPAWVRTPTTDGDTVVFAAASRLWTVPVSGGEAEELSVAGDAPARPHFSPDGRWLAYSARVDGNAEVFVQAWPDGEARRLTWHRSKDEVVGWAPDGAAVWFRSGRHDPSGYAEVFAVPVEGGVARPILPGGSALRPMSESAAAEPGGTRLVATDRHVAWLAWARNTGGLAAGLRVGPPAGPMQRVGPVPAWDPHWVGARIFFTSDAGGWPRLGSMAPDGGDVAWHTDDAPGLRDVQLDAAGRAVFVRDGGLRLWEPETGERAVPVALPDTVRPRTDPVPLLGPGAALAAGSTADRFAVVQRGQIAEFGVGGSQVALHARAGVRYGPAALVDGGVLAQAHDGQRARLVWSRPDRRRDKALGPDLDAPLVALSVAPGGAHAAAVDTLRRVWWIDLQRGERRELGRSELEAPDTTLAWRPDGGALAFVLRDVRGQRGVFTVGTAGAPTRLSDPRVDAHAPTWHDGGVAFLAEQAPDIVLDHRDVAYVARHAALPMWTPNTLGPDGRRARPVGPPGPWQALHGGEGTVLGQRDGGVVALDAADAPWATDVGGCTGQPLLCLGEEGVVRASAAGPVAVAPLSDATLDVDRAAEWQQLVGEACGQVARHRWDRDFDAAAWQQACARARENAARVSSRRELTDVLRGMLAEVSAAHTFTWGGDTTKQARGARPVQLGAELSWTGSAWRVDRVLVPDALTPLPAPLADAGVRAGQCIHTVGGAPVSAVAPPAAQLPRGNEEAVVLGVGDCAGARVVDVSVRPTLDEGPLRLADTVRQRAGAVRARSMGRVAYIYMPDVNDLGLVAFEQSWAGQRGAEALILDLRRNGGGWYSDAIVGRLARTSGARFRWTGGGDQTWPIRSGGVPVFVLVDAGTMSEGEILTRGLQLRGATVIGERTWGGLSGDVTPRLLVDGGGVGVPAVVWIDPEHGTGLERSGVQPDVLVDTAWSSEGADPWLEAALDAAMGTR